jgi:putative chitobiose transport system permease protein
MTDKRVNRSAGRRPKDLVKRLTLSMVAALTALLFLSPIVWMVSSALRPKSEIFKYLSPLSVQAVVPVQLTLENFQKLLSGRFPRTVFNSVFVSGLTVLGGVLICAMAAFALSAIQFRGREAVFVVIVVSFMIPFDAIAIPLSSLVRNWGLENTYAGLVLPAVANGLSIFVLRQFFLGIPAELKEAAVMDGASWWTIFWSIYMRLSAPALIAAGLTLFVWQWQAYMWPLLISTLEAYDLAAVAVAKYMGLYSFDFGQMFAGCLIISVIPAVVMLPLQRFFTQSIARTGIK